MADEKTPKKYKATGCICGIVMIAGIFILISGLKDSKQGQVAFGAVLSVGAFLFAVINKILLWWNHG